MARDQTVKHTAKVRPNELGRKNEKYTRASDSFSRHDWSKLPAFRGSARSIGRDTTMVEGRLGTKDCYTRLGKYTSSVTSVHGLGT